MKVALIFPPQWDPRQPPLCIPTLAGVLKPDKHNVRAWDMNLSLYRSILFKEHRSVKKQKLINKYLNPRILADLERFDDISDKVEDLIDEGYHSSDEICLLWDHLDDGPSPNRSHNWKKAIREPNSFLFYQRIQPLILKVVEWLPDLVCISVYSDTQIFGGLSVASGIRSGLPKTKIVMGGHALRVRRQLLTEHDWLFKTVNAICISHGEPTLEALAQDMPLEKVPNILWHDGRTVVTPKELEPVCVQTAYEPDFSVIELDQYLSPQTVIPIETARGCPWAQCSFCGHTNIELTRSEKYIQRPLSNVLCEVQKHVSKGFNKFFFVDDAIPYNRFKALSTGLANIKSNLSWICYLRSESTFDISTFRLARQSGCKKLFIGLETGSDRLMNLFRKGTTPDITKRFILDASQAGLAIHLFLLAGFPDESEADRKATHEFLKDILPSVDGFGFSYDVCELKAVLDTPLYIQPELFGARGLIRRPVWDLQYDFHMIPANTDNYLSHSKSEKRIGKIVKKCLEEQDSLSELESINDSTHLLLLENRPSARR